MKYRAQSSREKLRDGVCAGGCIGVNKKCWRRCGKLSRGVCLEGVCGDKSATVWNKLALEDKNLELKFLQFLPSSKAKHSEGWFQMCPVPIATHRKV